MSGHVRNSSAQIEEELEQIRRYEDFSTIGIHEAHVNTMHKHSN